MKPEKENEAFLNVHYHSQKQTNKQGSCCAEEIIQLAKSSRCYEEG